MDRRMFLQGLAVSAATAPAWGRTSDKSALLKSLDYPEIVTAPIASGDLNGHSLLCSFQHNGRDWKVYEDLRTRDGLLTFLCLDGQGKQLRKVSEATFAEANPPYLGLSLKEIGLSAKDLLADRL